MTLDKKFLAEAEKSLLEEQSRIKSELERISKPTDISGAYETAFNEIGTNEDENASEVEEYTDNLALENNLEKQLKETEDALRRIELGTYGFCENCKKEIPVERLRAYPAAKNCLNCE